MSTLVQQTGAAKPPLVHNLSLTSCTFKTFGTCSVCMRQPWALCPRCSLYWYVLWISGEGGVELQGPSVLNVLGLVLWASKEQSDTGKPKLIVARPVTVIINLLDNSVIINIIMSICIPVSIGITSIFISVVYCSTHSPFIPPNMLLYYYISGIKWSWQ